ncbi:MAG: hypothetical protein IJH04_03410 [Eggerthellaceae bacterium]|nr:hypothetical protein [Eggerthellaceae bacterium]
MASQDFLQQLINGVIANPSLLDSVAEHPYSTIRAATGTEEEYSREEASQAIAALSTLAGGQQLDFNNLAQMAAAMLAANGNSVHEMAGSLFNTPTAEEAAAAKEAETELPASALASNADMIANLAGVVFGKSMAGVNLSDGIDLGDVIGIASAFLGGKK